MDDIENIEKENLSPLLPLGRGANPFNVPNDYFDYLPGEITERIHAVSKSKEKTFILKPSLLIPSLAILSGIIILLVFLLKKDISSDEIMLSENEIEQIINNPELYNIDESTITDEYLSSNLSNESLNEETTVSDDDIKSYLEDNTDANNIINQL